MGTFHSVTRKHLPNYLNEFEFRWNTRKLDDGERVSRAVKVDGKRLKYRESVDCPPILFHQIPSPEEFCFFAKNFVFLLNFCPPV